jgi:hypothetical protein
MLNYDTVLAHGTCACPSDFTKQETTNFPHCLKDTLTITALDKSQFERAQHTQQKLPVQTTMTAKEMNTETVKKLTDAALAPIQNDRIIAEEGLQEVETEGKLREKLTQQAKTVATAPQQATPAQIKFTIPSITNQKQVLKVQIWKVRSRH